jgi:hypothetical protein
MRHTVRSFGRTDRRRTASNVALVQPKCSAGNGSLPRMRRQRVTDTGFRLRVRMYQRVELQRLARGKRHNRDLKELHRDWASVMEGGFRLTLISYTQKSWMLGVSAFRK